MIIFYKLSNTHLVILYLLLQTLHQRTIQLFNIRIRSYETDSGYPSLIDLAQDVNKYRDFYGNIQLEHKVKNTNVEAEDPMVG